MAFRYVAVVYSDPDRLPVFPPCPETHNLTRVFQTRRCAAWATHPGITLEQDGPGGVILGNLFRRTTPAHAVKALDRSSADRITGSGGSDLIHSYWGGYAALLSPTGGERTHILRDPSGALPCYYVTTADGTWIASDIELLVSVGGLVPQIDSTGLARHLFAADLRSPRTALMGVRELLAGQCLHLPERQTTELWSPWSHAMGLDDRPRDQLAEDLKRALEGCVCGWAGLFQHVLLSLSGGLDSSVLACALGRSPARTTCLTLSTADPDGDERTYARLAATSQNLELLEATHNLSDIDIEQSTSAHLPRPAQYPFAQSANRVKWAASREMGIDAYFSGVGGDNVFCHLRSASPLVDRYRAKGSLPDLWATLADICRMTGCSYGEALRHAAKRQLRPSPRYAWHGVAGFLSRAAIDEIGDTLYHPWLEAPTQALPGKAAHVAHLTRIQGTIDGFPRHWPPDITPLLSQPLVELCLGIPTWRWCEAGRDRSVARRAFKTDLPEAVIHRTSKGTPNVFAFEIVERNRERLRAVLREGYLAREGLIDSDAVERVLAPAHVLTAPDHILLLGLSEAEVWIAHWQTYGQPTKPPREVITRQNETPPDSRAGPP
ncbi:asparagine synthase-related protein [Asticcacaulis excentricus]|uniref:asparagine synthase (glutamine-hydrolyzing) n=1 Tax=Asticcacaulis excentricus (strain ATCC 15261 / DSM 4724 / KCTC 12464 / NCIMB 9791 / VKM B-1370 / CB 48) TaxID=573065 RepID=E8RUP6_ASTEC|nr:asparagine synthase-related protein [Asticcacaulis excentricus]ADU14096.1 asparagine synthase [Asticcacaulis excentricus CB 48]